MIKKSIVDECAGHMTLFVQSLSLELAELAISLRPSSCTLRVKFRLIADKWSRCSLLHVYS